jgi:anti-sigma regulatory factor (Ser/Thr protein kinase)
MSKRERPAASLPHWVCTESSFTLGRQGVVSSVITAAMVLGMVRGVNPRRRGFELTLLRASTQPRATGEAGEVTMRIACTFPAETATAGLARLTASELLAALRVDDELVETVLLVVSELVTNAIVHAHSAVDFAITVDDMVVRIDVADREPARPERRSSGPETVGGHGLNLVDATATEWGTEPRVDGLTGKVVWAVLSRP